jgi:hypothetical protein
LDVKVEGFFLLYLFLSVLVKPVGAKIWLLIKDEVQLVQAFSSFNVLGDESILSVLENCLGLS